MVRAEFKALEKPLSGELDPRNKAFLDFTDSPELDTAPVMTALKKDLVKKNRKLSESLSESLDQETQAVRKEFIRVATQSELVVDKALDVFFTIPEERERLVKKATKHGLDLQVNSSDNLLKVLTITKNPKPVLPSKDTMKGDSVVGRHRLSIPNINLRGPPKATAVAVETGKERDDFTKTDDGPRLKFKTQVAAHPVGLSKSLDNLPDPNAGHKGLRVASVDNKVADHMASHNIEKPVASDSPGKTDSLMDFLAAPEAKQAKPMMKFKKRKSDDGKSSEDESSVLNFGDDDSGIIPEPKAVPIGAPLLPILLHMR